MRQQIDFYLRAVQDNRGLKERRYFMLAFFVCLTENRHVSSPVQQFIINYCNYSNMFWIFFSKILNVYTYGTRSFNILIIFLFFFVFFLPTYICVWHTLLSYGIQISQCYQSSRGLFSPGGHEGRHVQLQREGNVSCDLPPQFG